MKQRVSLRATFAARFASLVFIATHSWCLHLHHVRIVLQSIELSLQFFFISLSFNQLVVQRIILLIWIHWSQTSNIVSGWWLFIRDNRCLVSRLIHIWSIIFVLQNCFLHHSAAWNIISCILLELLLRYHGYLRYVPLMLRDVNLKLVRHHLIFLHTLPQISNLVTLNLLKR